MTKKPLVAVAFASLALLGFGCSPTQMIADKLSEKAAEGIINSQLGGEGKVDLSNGTMNVKSKDGNVSYGENVKLPADFPSDVPAYESMKIVMVTSKDKTASYLGTSTDKSDTVSDWYLKTLQSKGWKKTSDQAIIGSLYYQFEKDTRTLTVAVGGDQEADPIETTITLTVEPKS